MTTRTRVPTTTEEIKASMAALVEHELGSAIIRALHRGVSERGPAAVTELRASLREAFLGGPAGLGRDLYGSVVDGVVSCRVWQDERFRDTG